ncbi:ABC transporter ATP-binding protein [Caballeronia sordidicola]|uniref:ABC transporter ATP-binding protein n=1 Tax=Caballeronia sordidicola TaxID=196367 RepID=UPI00094C78E6|nr:ABC transporter ATP-binding protein [Caballeronia sordidicola]
MGIAESRSPPVHFSLSEISQAYRMGEEVVPVLKRVTFTVRRGETCALLGTSGSGKSTLLNIVGLLDRPDSGQYHFNDRNMLTADADELALIRNRQFGFVFQAFNLLPRLTALDNVALPLMYRGIGRRCARDAASEQLHRVGLADRAEHRPAELSGGQRQRVAIARALVGQPSVILADEPTGNLDTATADDIVTLLLALNQEHGVTLVVVTHDVALANRFSRKLEVRSGELYESLL